MSIDLSRPPEVVNCAIGHHGIQRDVDVFRIPDLWAFHLYGYDAELILDGVAHRVQPGSVSLIPPGVSTEYRYRGPSQHRYAHLRAGVGDAPTSLVVDPNPALTGLADRFASAVSHAATTPERTQAELWLALLTVTAHHLDPAGPTESGAVHVTRALQWIEAHLDQPITVPAVAEAAGLSHTHLTRLVRDRTGRTVVAWIRHRRITRAVHLLQNSTLSVSAVAASTGFGDLQAFNKACRQETGQSPRTLRK